MGYGRIRISGALMREMFHFPAETVFCGGERPDEVEVIVSHPDILDGVLAEGERPPTLMPMFRKQEPIVFEGWGQK